MYTDAVLLCLKKRAAYADELTFMKVARQYANASRALDKIADFCS